MTTENLLAYVRLAINPQFEDWVLFKNGTYVIFDDASSITDIPEAAIAEMKEYGPVQAGGPAGDFNVTNLDETEGWVVSGHGYGMYTYVPPSELTSPAPTDLEVGLFGRMKRSLDGQNPAVLHVNARK
ncbi:MAG: hypothetical protein M3Y12_08475 [Bacteroidota bacterium]|nr:hypothetical protein [Bacteroidota bacterium]